MLRKKTALVVESPFQMLCAYEAFKRESKEVDIFVRLNGQCNNDNQLREISEQIFDRVVFLNAPLNSSIRMLVSLLRLTLSSYVKNYQRVYLGSYHSGFMRRYSSIFRKRNREIFFLDDGMATLLLGHDDKSAFCKKGYALFSIFSGMNEMFFVEGHRFEGLRDFVSAEPNERKNIFIGQPLVERGYVSCDTYVECIRLAVSRCSEPEMLYIAHRSESAATLSLVSEIEGCVVVVPDVCVEWYLIRNGIKPVRVFGFSSTALLSLSMIYENVIVYFFDCPYLNYPYPDHQENIIAYFSGFENFHKLSSV